MPRLTCIATFYLGLIIASLLASNSTAQAVNPGLDGNLYVAQVLKSLQAPVNVDAKLRFESLLYDQKIVGQGIYQQGGQMSKRFTRWEMQTQIADQTASFVQIYDGIHLWSARGMPSGRQVARLDVERLQTGLQAHFRSTPMDERQLLLTSVAGQGGLVQLLADLLSNYNFQSPQPTQLNGLPVNALVGHWRETQLAKHWPGSSQLGSEKPPEWPQQLPHHVLLLVHKHNLFPCVVEHRTAGAAQYATSLSGLRPIDQPLMRYEIYEINFAVAVPDQRFEFNAGGSWTGQTKAVLEQLKGELGEAEVSAAN